MKWDERPWDPREEKRFNEELDGLIGVAVRAYDQKHFYKVWVTSKVFNRYDVPWKDDQRFKLEHWKYIQGRVDLFLHGARNMVGERVYECYSAGDGWRWQEAREFTVRQARAVTSEYRARAHALNIKHGTWKEVIQEAEQLQLGEDDSVRAAWDAVMERRQEARAA